MAIYFGVNYVGYLGQRVCSHGECVTRGQLYIKNGHLLRFGGGFFGESYISTTSYVFLIEFAIFSSYLGHSYGVIGVSRIVILYYNNRLRQLVYGSFTSYEVCGAKQGLASTMYIYSGYPARIG